MGDIVFLSKSNYDKTFVIHVPSWDDFMGLFRKKKPVQATVKRSGSYFDRPPPRRHSVVTDTSHSYDREVFYAITPR